MLLSSRGRMLVSACAVSVAFLASSSSGSAAPSSSPEPAADTATSAQVSLPADYVIGSGDVLSIVFWRDKDLSSDVVVRPDGKVSLSLINDVHAAGLTPEQLRVQVEAASKKYLTDPSVAVVVKEIHSRNVFIAGQVTKPGTYPLAEGMTVLQLIAVAGGVLEYADSKNIAVMRSEQGAVRSFKFNYKDVVRQKNVEQNITLRPGDTVVVP